MGIQIIDFGESGVTDHGDLTGLTDDDHTQYLLINTDEAGRIVYYYGSTVPSSPVEGAIWIEKD